MINSQEYCNYNQLSYYLNKQGIANDTLFIRWVKEIMNTKIGLFKYKNLPNGLTSQIIENALLFNNFLCWYYDEKLGGLILCRWVANSDYNMYWLPKSVNLLTISGVSIKNNVKWEDIIPCRDNTMDIIPFITLKNYIDKIIEIEKTIDINIKICRFPMILKGTKQEVGQLKQLVKKMYDCEGIAIASNDLTGRLESNDIHLPMSITELYDLMVNYRNNCLQSIGIYSQKYKTGRVLTQEIESANDYTDNIYTEMREERQEWVDAINAKWGLNIALVETYDITYEEDTELMSEREKELANIEEEKQIAINESKEKGGNTNE